jgi:hypothetical protein
MSIDSTKNVFKKLDACDRSLCALALRCNEFKRLYLFQDVSHSQFFYLHQINTWFRIFPYICLSFLIFKALLAE